VQLAGPLGPVPLRIQFGRLVDLGVLDVRLCAERRRRFELLDLLQLFEDPVEFFGCLHGLGTVCHQVLPRKAG